MAASIELLTDKIKHQDRVALVDSRSLSLPEPTYRGKVRDTYDIGNGELLIVATDRISTYDCIHPNGIPGKGIILTQMSLNWMERFKDISPNHLISSNPRDFPEPFRSIPELDFRSMLVKKLNMLPVECIIRGYITGSAWAEYKKLGTVAGQLVRKGILESEVVDDFPLFTPSTKAETGHDENINYEQTINLLSEKFGQEMGKSLTEMLKATSLVTYYNALLYAASRGIIIADTKFEFGLDKKGDLVLADEVLTPDSSRFWAREFYQAGRTQDSFDKQYVRDWATNTGWNRNPPAPEIPLEVVQKTQDKYLEAYRRLFA